MAWNLISASVAGSSHSRDGTPCQDAYQCTLTENGWLLIAVADGAGSAKHSQLGAVRAVQAVITWLEEALQATVPQDEAGWEGLLFEAFERARAAVLALAAQDDRPARLFASTLTVVIASDDWLVTGQVGDGVVVAQTASGELLTVLPPQRGEYANETYFLIADDALDSFTGRIYRQNENLEPLSALAVMTDGLLRLAFDLSEDRPHAPFFKPLLDFAANPKNLSRAHEQLRAFLDSPRINARTDDDKTLVLAAKIP